MQLMNLRPVSEIGAEYYEKCLLHRVTVHRMFRTKITGEMLDWLYKGNNAIAQRALTGKIPLSDYAIEYLRHFGAIETKETTIGQLSSEQLAKCNNARVVEIVENVQ